MAGGTGQTSDDLIRELAADPYRFDFFWAVRLLESSRKDLPRVGHSLTPQQDAVRFQQSPSLAFAPSTIDSVVPGVVRENDLAGVPDAHRFIVRFFGLFGPNGPLPIHLTEYALDRLKVKDKAFVAFANIFHHRLISLFYRAWADNQKAVDMDRPEDQRFTAYFGSLFGACGDAFQHRDTIQDNAKLFFAGHMAAQSRSPEALHSILQSYFEIPAKVIPFQGRWLSVPGENLLQLGANGRLGVDTILGGKFWSCQLAFRIRLGPMNYADYQRMLPGGAAYKRLEQWIRAFIGDELTWEAQLVLDKAEVPAARLGSGVRLGWTVWLQTVPPPVDQDNLVLSEALN
jgi:type VI secretion system protein ImpH